MPSRIVHLTAAYPPRLGGMEVVAQELAQHTALQQDVPVEVVTTSVGASQAPKRSQEGAVEVRRHRALELAHTPFSPGLVWRLFRLPRGSLLHVHVAQALLLEVAVLISWLRGHRLVAHLHLDVAQSGPVGRLLPVYKRFFLGPALRRADAVLVLNGDLQALVTQTYRVIPDRVRLMPNGVSEAFFASVQPASPAPSPGQVPLRALFVGRLERQKNLGRLLEALTQVHALVTLDVVGDGELRAEWEQQARRLGLADRVQFHGARYAAELRQSLAAADVLVLPSDHEGMPLIVLEAMASGTPVLATDVSGTRELVAGAGYLVPATPSGLAAGLTDLATNRGELDRLRAAGLEKAGHHRWPRITDEVLAVYKELVHQ